MESDDQFEVVLVTGGSGLVGRAVQRVLVEKLEDWTRKRLKFAFVSSEDGDLTDLKQTYSIFQQHKPNYVIHLAAKVGGLFKNMNDNDAFFRVNQGINNNVLRCASEYRVKKCISCLSTCIFPDNIEYPIDETKIHLGPPHSSNFGYALAKRQVDLLNKHYNRLNPDSLFTAIIPTNVYGPGDNFNLESAHVVPSLIHKAYNGVNTAQAFNEKATTLIVYGTGTPVRQFIYSLDLAKLILWTLLNYTDEDPLILCPDENDEVTIGEVAQVIASTISKRLGIEVSIRFDAKFSDGQVRKTASNRKLRELYSDFTFTKLKDGLEETIEWFCNSYPAIRK